MLIGFAMIISVIAGLALGLCWPTPPPPPVDATHPLNALIGSRIVDEGELR
ncbi:hypothetical protein GCM10022231_23820 [Gordonia caeni]|uniref:Uncharacterized protein n=2 Tax=Gordonia caeni TaxID=1007097 RepID=A0ABP7PBB8_9ACTN